MQDNWKVRSNLALDYGMRFSILKPWYEEQDQISSFIPAAYDPQQRVAVPAGSSQWRTVSNDPLTGQAAPAALIGAIAPGSGNPSNGRVTPADAASLASRAA